MVTTAPTCIKASPEEGERAFLHRGIAARQFQRSFVLAEHVEIESASLERGLLHINLIRHKPETVVRTIKIEAVE